jgi:hypothetical protein
MCAYATEEALKEEAMNEWVTGLLVNLSREVTRSLAEIPGGKPPDFVELSFTYKGIKADVRIDFGNLPGDCR